VFGVKRRSAVVPNGRQVEEASASGRVRVGLRLRLLVAFLLVAALPVTALFLAQYREIERWALADAERLIEQVADVQQRRINRELDRLLDQVRLVASRTQMRLSLAQYNRSGTADDLLLIERILNDALSPMPDLEGIWIRDAGGTLVAGASRSEPPALARTDVPESAASRETRMELDWADDASPWFWLSSPLELDNETIGSLHLRAEMGEMFNILQDFSYADLVGESILVLSRPEGAPLWVSARSPLPTSAEDWASPLAVAGSVERVRSVDGLSIQRPLAFDGAALLVRVSVDGVEDLKRWNIRWLVVELPLILLLSLAMSLLLARMISRPIEMLKEATLRLRSGDIGTQVPEVSWGEFAELTRSFNATSQTLARRTAALETEIHAHRKARRKLANLANTDPLTGLANRRYFMQRLTRKLEQSCSAATCGWLLYLDLDGFKPVNDQNGHEIGDEVLKVVAERIRGLVRDEDLAARIGGDEFVLLLAEAGPGADGDAIARRVEAVLSMPMSIEDLKIQVGCSIGVVALEPGRDPRELLNQADAEMYRVKTAKRQGALRSPGNHAP
jgi:diguanylate cyclase (GGDEF)-like protein